MPEILGKSVLASVPSLSTRSRVSPKACNLASATAPLRTFVYSVEMVAGIHHFGSIWAESISQIVDAYILQAR